MLSSRLVPTLIAGALLLAACAPAAPPAPTAAPAKPAEAAKPADGAKPAEAAKPAEPAKPAADVKQELVYVDGNDIVTLDGGFVSDLPSQSLLKLVFNNLVALSPKLEIVPELATSWEVSPDQKTWTFKLRPGAKFSSGTPVNAAAVKATLDRLLNKDTAAPNRVYFEQVTAVDVVDDTTVKITTAVPYPDLLLNLATRGGTINDPAQLAKFPVKDYGRNPIGSGPYKISEWVTGERIVLVPNENYWGEKPTLTKITYRPVPETAARAAMLRTGEGDVVVGLEPEELDNLEKDANLQIVRNPSFNFIMYEILVDKKPFDDLRVRKALNYAVDKEAIVKNILKGLGDQTCSPVGLGVGAEFQAKFDCYAYDPARAKQLLAEAGYPNGFQMELWSPTGRYIKDRQISEAVQGYLKAVGIDAKLQTFEWAQYRNKWNDTARQVWMIGRGTLGTDFAFTRLFTKAEWDKGSNNNTHFEDAKAEELIKQARSEFDKTKRAALYRDLQKIVWDNPTSLYLHTQRQVIGVRKNVAGLEFTPSEEVLMAKARRQ